ncbi:MAG: low molecular weight phosphotyrosine protein phosphatase [Gammaproteobacteria bacterium]|nr:low molecular weight phosphotyrosine protein phosphatase [Gammaproteobacteria bacterium]MBI5618849.1 low molecular weight phosphotyrosine protein phosphatase [Gammaproteobacteria bacterium]
MSAPPRRILFVCTGNLCRSPLARGLLAKHLALRPDAAAFTIDAAGTAAREGLPPTPYTLEVAARRGVDLGAHRSRSVVPADFTRFDTLVALDFGHLDWLRFMRPADARCELRLLLAAHARRPAHEVPDPYGKSARVYERVARLIELGVRAWLAEWDVAAR